MILARNRHWPDVFLRRRWVVRRPQVEGMVRAFARAIPFLSERPNCQTNLDACSASRTASARFVNWSARIRWRSRAVDVNARLAASRSRAAWRTRKWKFGYNASLPTKPRLVFQPETTLRASFIVRTGSRVESGTYSSVLIRTVSPIKRKRKKGAQAATTGG